MENQNVNQAELDAIKNRFKSSIESNQPKKKKSTEEILAQYFTPQRPAETFRVLRQSSNVMTDVWSKVYFHVVPLNTIKGVSQNQKVLCLNQLKLDANGNPILGKDGKAEREGNLCPLCLRAKEYADKQVQIKNPSGFFKKKEEMNPHELQIFADNRKLWDQQIKFEAKLFYVLKGIDRSKEHENIKFWRFKENRNGDGTFKLLSEAMSRYLYSENKDFASPVDGCDFIIRTIEKINNMNGKPYKEVVVIDPNAPSKLHVDPIISQSWLSNTLSWKEVYKPKTAPNVSEVEYMELIVNGQNPYYDENNKKWYFPGRPDLEEKANTRDRNLQGTDVSNHQPPIYHNYSNVSTMTENQVGTYKTNAINVADSVMSTPTHNISNTNTNDYHPNDNDYDDLPF